MSGSSARSQAGEVGPTAVRPLSHPRISPRENRKSQSELAHGVDADLCDAAVGVDDAPDRRAPVGCQGPRHPRCTSDSRSTRIHPRTTATRRRLHRRKYRRHRSQRCAGERATWGHHGAATGELELVGAYLAFVAVRAGVACARHDGARPHNGLARRETEHATTTVACIATVGTAAAIGAPCVQWSHSDLAHAAARVGGVLGVFADSPLAQSASLCIRKAPHRSRRRRRGTRRSARRRSARPRSPNRRGIRWRRLPYRSQADPALHRPGTSSATDATSTRGQRPQ